MSVWTTAYINNLPDSSFAYIAPGGKKDSDGNTTPRSLRYLPYKDNDGDNDAAHIRNALARLQATDIPDSVKPKIQKMLTAALAKANGKTNNDIIEEGTFRIEPVNLDSNGMLPTRIAVMKAGNWPDSVKGNFSISVDDLKEIKDNFDKGIGFPTEDSSTGLAIDFMHDYAAEAAGWIKGLELDANEGVLYGSPVEWTDAGAAAIQGGKFKCISPSGYFGSKNGKQMSMWSNPTNLKEKVRNVLDGAGLTNIPFLRGMSPIRADKMEDEFDNTASGYDNVIYVVQNQHKKENPMNLDSLRVKERNDLSIPEFDFLEENKAKLSAEELTKFKLEAAKKEEEGEKLSAEDKALLDAIKSGDKKVVNKEELSAEEKKIADLEKTALDYKTEKAQAVVNGHISRGAIKQDASEFWTKQLLSVEGDDRKALEDQLSAIPDNELLKEEFNKEKGTSEDVAAGSTAREQYDVLAKGKVAAAAKDGKELLYADALKEVMRENPDLGAQDTKEQLTGAK